MVTLRQTVGQEKRRGFFTHLLFIGAGVSIAIFAQLALVQPAFAVSTTPETKPIVTTVCGGETVPESDADIAAWNACAQKVMSQYATCNTGGADSTQIAQCLKTGLGTLVGSVKVQDLKAAVEQGKAAATAEPKTEEECKAKGDTWEWNAETNKCSEKGAQAGKAECTVSGGMGWAICPVMTILSTMNDVLYTAIAGFLVVEPGLFDTSAKSPYPAWQQFQSIANVIFIIGFIVVVYSQITGAGLSNYGVKKMLPKLIVIAILVNVSYFLCQLAVDVSNLLGVSLKSVFDAIAGQNVTEVNAATGGWTKIVAIVLAAAGAGVLLLAVSVPVLLAAFLALAMIALILIVRKALIVLLIVVSPVAFALYLLPNTEQWAKKWGKLFFSLLMLYPVIAVVFGASALASSVLLNIEGDLNKIVALGASALPLFIVPGLLKGALSATGKLGAKMQGWGDKATGRVRAKSRETSRLGTALSDASKYRAQRRAISLAGKRNRGLTGIIARRAGGEGYGERLETQAAALEDKEFEENVAAAQASHKTMTNSEVEDIAHGRTAASDAERVAAVREIMKNGNHEQRMAMLASSAGQSDRAKQSIRDGAYAKGMNAYLGGSIGDKVMRGEIGSQADLDQSIVETANAGKLTAEGMVSDGTAANRIHSVLEASRTGTAQQVDTGQKDASGNPVMHTVVAPTDPKRTVTAAGLKQAGQAAQQAQTLPATRGRIAGNMAASINNMSRY